MSADRGQSFALFVAEVSMSESYCLLTGSKTVHGDHESANDDESYAKPNNWDWQDNCKNGWDD